MFNKPMCYDCVHFDEEAEYSTTKPSPRCAAFDHIPADIFLSQFDHRNATEGDNGIQFEPKKVLPGHFMDYLLSGGHPYRDRIRSIAQGSGDFFFLFIFFLFEQ